MSSYADLREVNVLGLRPVLELCLRIRYKHLFYVSTMGVFPEYSYNFAREYSRSRIDDQMQPDLGAMKKAFPLGAIGYPWSKLVAEQGVLFAKAAGVPVGIFRLPLTGLPSTGYAQANDVPTRLFSAAAQLERAPKGFTIQKSGEPADTVCEICAAISLNPNRRFTVYHWLQSEAAPRGCRGGGFRVLLAGSPLRVLPEIVQSRRRHLSAARTVGVD